MCTLSPEGARKSWAVRDFDSIEPLFYRTINLTWKLDTNADMNAVERAAPRNALQSVVIGSARARLALNTQYGTSEMLMYSGKVFRKVPAPAVATANMHEEVCGWSTLHGTQGGWSSRMGN